MTNLNELKRLFSNPKILFIVSLVTTIGLLSFGKWVIVLSRHHMMIEGAASSYRRVDGAPNLLVMQGDSGYIGTSKVHIKYLKDGFIRISGVNDTDSDQWKIIGTVYLSPGCYTFTGLAGIDAETVDLQLDYRNDADTSYEWYFLWNEDIQFCISKAKMVEIYVRVAPNAQVDLTAQPAIYWD